MASFLERLLQTGPMQIDAFFAEKVGMTLTRFRASGKELPGFRFVDLFLATERFAEEHGPVAECSPSMSR